MSPATDPLSLEAQLCFALAVASRTVIAAYKPSLDPMGLTHPQYLVMLALWQSHPRTLTDVADILRLEPATVSPMIKRLESAGLVTRKKSDVDERTLQISLTTAGSDLRVQAVNIPLTVADNLGVDAEFLTDIHARLSSLIERIAPLKSGASTLGQATELSKRAE